MFEQFLGILRETEGKYRPLKKYCDKGIIFATKNNEAAVKNRRAESNGHCTLGDVSSDSHSFWGTLYTGEEILASVILAKK